MSTFNPEKISLGKKLGVVEDPRTFKLKNFLPKALPTAPKTSTVGKGAEVQMFANDQFGCCTCAAHGHRIAAQEKASRQKEVRLTSMDVLAAYSAVTGFNQGDASTDNGAYMLDVLNFMRTYGMGREADGSPHHIGAFVKVRHSNKEELKVASWMFGGLYIGAWLPNTAAEQIRAGKPWSVKGYEDLNAEPGSWGGHAMHSLAYSSTGITLATWGQLQNASWDWVAAYVDEAYVVISEDLLYGTGKTPQGFNMDRLQTELQALGS